MGTLSERLQSVLDEQKISAYALSKMTGISEATIGRILRGINNPSDASLLMICAELNISVDWLRDGSGKKEATGERKITTIEVTDRDGIGYRIGVFFDKKGIRAIQVGNKIGLSSQTVYNVLRGKLLPPIQLITKLIEFYPELNPEWLLTGKGEMIKEEEGLVVKVESNAVEIPIPQPGEEHELELIRKEHSSEFRRIDDELYMVICPLVTQYAYAGYIAGWADSSYVDELPKHAVMMRNLTLGVYRAFTVRGDSMDNGLKGAISNGDIVTGRKLYEKYWKSKLHLHQYKHFIIVTDEGIQVKEIIEHRVDEGIIVCHSLNEDKKKYPDFELSLADVKELYYIKARTEPLE